MLNMIMFKIIACNHTHKIAWSIFTSDKKQNYEVEQKITNF